MINGFVVIIYNEFENAQSIRLFKDENLPKGISVYIRNTEHDYRSLIELAHNEEFIGKGLHTDCELSITIINGLNVERFFSNFMTDKKIEIDGFSKYIELDIPQKTEIMFQLMPYF